MKNAASKSKTYTKVSKSTLDSRGNLVSHSVSYTDTVVPVASSASRSAPIFGNLMTAISCLLLFLAVVGFLTNGGGVNASLQSFVSALSRAPVVSTDWCQSLISFTIQGDWGVLDFLKEFFNSFVGFVGVLGYLATGIAQALVFCAYFVAYIF